AAPPSAINYYEWCQDHNKPLEVAPLGDVARAARLHCPVPTFSRMALGMAARPIWVRMQLCAPSRLTAPHQDPRTRTRAARPSNLPTRRPTQLTNAAS